MAGVEVGRGRRNLDRELRQLTSSLNIIATKLERDPANFLFTGKQGYSPK